MRKDFITLIPTSDDPDMVAAGLLPDVWDAYAEVLELEHRRLMRTDPLYRRHITRARDEWVREINAHAARTNARR